MVQKVVSGLPYRVGHNTHESADDHRQTLATVLGDGKPNGNFRKKKETSPTLITELGSKQTWGVALKEKVKNGFLILHTPRTSRGQRDAHLLMHP